MPLNTEMPAIHRKHAPIIVALYAVSGSYLLLHAMAAAIALFRLLEWSWESPARYIGLTMIIFLLASSSFGACINSASGDKWKRLGAALSVAASCFFTGSIISAYWIGKTAVIGAVGGFVLAAIGVALWLQRPSFQLNVQTVFSRVALLAASLSSYGLTFLCAASAIAAFQGKQMGWFFILVLLFFAFGLLTWRLANKGSGENAVGPAQQ